MVVTQLTVGTEVSGVILLAWQVVILEVTRVVQVEVKHQVKVQEAVEVVLLHIQEYLGMELLLVLTTEEPVEEVGMAVVGPMVEVEVEVQVILTTL